MVAAVAFAAGLSAVVLESSSTPASAAVVGFQQCNAHDLPATTGAPLVVNCSVTITNNVDSTGGSAITVRSMVCENDDCTGDTVTGDLINAVNQCNFSDNVGGSVTTCSVHVINNISKDSPAAASALTLNQCIGSSATSDNTLTCIPSSQGTPTVTQCNGSGNGGGTPMTCTASGTVSSDFPVTVNQCNNSENGGGSSVTCDVTMETNIVDTAITTPETTPTTVAPGEGTPGGGLPGGGTPGGGLPGTPETGTPGTGTPGTGIPGTPETGTPGTPGTPFVEVPPNYTG